MSEFYLREGLDYGRCLPPHIQATSSIFALVWWDGLVWVSFRYGGAVQAEWRVREAVLVLDDGLVRLPCLQIKWVTLCCGCLCRHQEVGKCEMEILTVGLAVKVWSLWTSVTSTLGSICSAHKLSPLTSESLVIKNGGWKKQSWCLSACLPPTTHSIFVLLKQGRTTKACTHSRLTKPSNYLFAFSIQISAGPTCRVAREGGSREKN